MSARARKPTAIDGSGDLGAGAPRLGVRDALLLLAFAAVALAIYQPSFGGAFFSDDQHYVSENAYVHELSFANLRAIWSPVSGVSELVENYAPVHLTANALAWRAFGNDTTGYHVLNTLVHALAAWLLALVWMRFGLSWALSAGLAAIFLVHPANVEAVAWIAQLKTGLSMALALLALLAYERRPGAGLVLFALALLAKPTAVFALPVAALAGAFGVFERPKHWHWMAAWALVFGAFALAEFAAFYETAGRAPPIYPELDVRLRTICAIALRYVALAASGLGLSMFRETPPAASWFDPWFLGSLALLGVLAYRLIAGLLARRRESIFWAWAAISFAPISGVIPLPHPMADRYLYFMLPGLLGGLAFALRSLLGEGPQGQRRWPRGLPFAASQAGLAVCAVAVLGFALQTHARAGIWTTADRLMLDAALHYPGGVAARTREAHRLALAGDVDGTVRALRAAMARGYNRLDHLLQDPAYHPLHEVPAFQAILHEMASEMVERLGSRAHPSQMQWRVIAQAHLVLGELDEAVRALEQAVEVGGPLAQRSGEELEELRRRQRTRDRLEALRVERPRDLPGELDRGRPASR